MDGLVKYRWFVLLAVVMVLAALAPGLSTSLVPDHNLDVWFLDDDPNLQSYEIFQEDFGNDEVVVVRSETPQGGLSRQALTSMVEASQTIGEIEGVEQVHSALSVMVAFSEEGADRVPLELRVEDIPDSEEALEEFGEAARNHPLIDGHLLDDPLREDGGDGYALVVQMEASDDFDDRRPQILAELEEALDSLFDDGDYQRGGVGVIYQALNDLTERDFGIFLGLGYLVMFAVLLWVFRSVRLVLAALFVVAGGTIAALGTMGWLGIQVNMITVLLPTLIVVLGIADAMHFPVAYRRICREQPDADDAAVLAESLRAAAVPCLMTAVTTMAGFVALASSSLAGVRQLGLFAVVGVGAAFVISLPVMAVALQGRGRHRVRELPGLEALLATMKRWVTDAPKVVGLALIIIIAVSLLGASKVEVDTYTLGFLPADHDVVLDDQKLEATLGPYIPLEWTYEPRGERDVESAELLQKSALFAARVQEHERTGTVLHLEKLYRFVADEVWQDIGDDPLSAEQVTELRELFAELAEGEASMAEAMGMVASGRSMGRITVPVEMMSASGLADTIEWMQQIANEEFGDTATVRPSGYLPLYATVIDHVVDSQIRSFGIAVVAIFLLMLLWLRSLRLALISLIPNLFPVLVMLGAMGFLGIHLDAVTAVVAAIVIGVAIDDTVHFLHSWRRSEQDGGGWSDHLQRAMNEVGPAICITTLVLVAGYSVLLFADLVTVIYFGLLTIIAAIAALIGEFLLLPLLLRGFGDIQDDGDSR